MEQNREDEENQKRSEAAAAMGRIRTPKKAAAARENGKLGAAFGARGGRPLKPLAELKCVCGKCPDDPKTYCPRGRAIISRREKGVLAE